MDSENRSISSHRIAKWRPAFGIGIRGAILIFLTVFVFAVLTAIVLNILSGVKIDNVTQAKCDENKVVTTEAASLLRRSTYRLVTRSEWSADKPRVRVPDLDSPAKEVIIGHTENAGCLTQASCAFRLRSIQSYHLESKKLNDIAYNFLVGGDGAAYEGRGWNKKGDHIKKFNEDAISVAFIGTFDKNIPRNRQLLAAKILLDEGVQMGKLISNYKLHSHPQLLTPENSGAALYNVIKTWPNWTNETIPVHNAN